VGLRRLSSKRLSEQLAAVRDAYDAMLAEARQKGSRITQLETNLRSE
jgi:hypothetical protein